MKLHSYTFQGVQYLNVETSKGNLIRMLEAWAVMCDIHEQPEKHISKAKLLVIKGHLNEVNKTRGA